MAPTQVSPRREGATSRIGENCKLVRTAERSPSVGLGVVAESLLLSRLEPMKLPCHYPSCKTQFSKAFAQTRRK